MEIDALPPLRVGLAEAKRDLDQVGVTRLAGALSAAEIAQALHRLEEQAAAESELGIAYHDDGHVRRHARGANQRVWNLLNKGEIFARLVTNSAVLTLAKHVLGNDILLSSCTANIARRGGYPQTLHSDQWWAPQIAHALMANCFIMLNEFSDQNGATRIVPGSHLTGAARGANPAHASAATGQAGTILAFDARVLHGTGANLTQVPRYGLLLRYCQPFIRQQENMCVSLAPEVLSACSTELKALVGFQVWNTFGMMGDDVHAQLHARRPDRFVTQLRPRRSSGEA